MPHRRTFLVVAVAVAALVGGITTSLRAPAASAQVVAATAACTDTGNGQSNCTVTTQVALSATGGLSATLQNPGVTFVSCNVSSALGTCPTSPSVLTFVCTLTCPVGTQFTEVVQGSAALAMAQTFTSTAVGTAGYPYTGYPYANTSYPYNGYPYANTSYPYNGYPYNNTSYPYSSYPYTSYPYTGYPYSNTSYPYNSYPYTGTSYPYTGYPNYSYTGTSYPYTGYPNYSYTGTSYPYTGYPSSYPYYP